MTEGGTAAVRRARQLKGCGGRGSPRPRPPPSPSGRPARPPSVRADDVRVPVSGALDRALLCAVVDVDQAEALVVAVGPLEVVQQGPGEVAGQRGALAGGRGAGGEVALQVVLAFGVVDRAVRAYDVGVRGAVLGDVQ